MPKKPNSIPDRWLEYQPVGQAIEGTRFIPFKVPLKQYLHDTNNIPEDQAFSPSDLLKVLGEKKLELGLLIDLTFTRRYYDSEEITSNDVQYEKVFTPGHHVPDRSVVNSFTEVVKKFEENNADNDLLIGVHCTHGVNRTGYLICRYMIEHLKFTPDDALKAYEKARGYPVERKNYIEDLRTRPRTGDEVPETSRSGKKHKRKQKNKKNVCQGIETDDGVVSPLPTGRSCHLSGNQTTEVHQTDDVNEPMLHNKSNTRLKETSQYQSDQSEASNIEPQTLLSDLDSANTCKQQSGGYSHKSEDSQVGMMLEEQVSGVVMKYCRRKNCFIRRHDNSSQIFGHHKSIAKVNAKRRFHVGDIVLFDVVCGDRGFEAVNILIGIPSSL
ncbi:RNA/RNP complex-1-interacting phosphatase-like isoform X2 [Amphiura filiformis]|uniref:RNA/RNP complex-1-interacting phosphatase-like isoform X2 n=1 Tax=Amphiura filiformis TaxID=82378 RepID=UPI003B224C43